MGSLIFRTTVALALLFFLWAVPVYAATAAGRVSWIYDGDTLKVDGIGKVRLIGIDTPERKDSLRDSYYRKRYGVTSSQLRAISEKALAFNIKNVKGQLVSLEFDQERYDKFGRTLAYLYLPNGTLLNRLLIEQGLAFVYRRFDFRLKQDFLNAEKQAQRKRSGLWAE